MAAKREEGGYKLTLEEGRKRHHLHCAYLVNAGGPWINDVVDCISPTTTQRRIDRVLGSHLVLEEQV